MQTATALHPADELGQVRRQKKLLETREGELRKLIIGDREARVGRECIAVVTDRASSTVDWKGLALSLGATPDQIAARTTSKVTTYVETERAPSLPEVLRILTTERLVVLDTETTGLSPAKGDRIVSVGILPVTLKAVAAGEELVHDVVEGNA
jgi:uncharacterized protein YprB with RNaseH-like and TPR domain